MSQYKNLENVTEESMELYWCLMQFGNIHEEVQELIFESEKLVDSQIYNELSQEVLHIRELVRQWVVAIDQRNQEGRQSIRSNRKSKSSKSSRSSISSYRAKAIEAKAKHAELKARIAYLDTVEATGKESERAKLMTVYLAAAAAI